jgi:hypothetical protein
MGKMRKNAIKGKVVPRRHMGSGGITPNFFIKELDGCE